MLRLSFNIIIRLTLCTLCLCPLALISQVEICDNALDDDLDGLIDLQDEDCACDIVEPTSLIPNSSFEDLDCCPSMRSELNCASGWIQASRPTTDFIHSCDWLGWDQFPPPTPFPDGDGIMGFRDGRVRNGSADLQWKEYAGACLISPLLAGTQYRFQFDVGFVDDEVSPPIDITFFGTTSCDFLPFGDDDPEFGCPTNGPNWQELSQVRVSAGEDGNTWVNAAIEIIPDNDIYAIAIGPSCDLIESPVSIYYYFDNLLLSDIAVFELQIRQNMHPCSDQFTLSVRENSSFEYQWYRDSIALVGEVFSELTQTYGPGAYQVRILSEGSCRLSTAFIYEIPTFNTSVSVNICDGDGYPFGNRMLLDEGIYIDTFKNVNNCDSIVNLTLNTIGATTDTLNVTLFQGQSYEISGNELEGEGGFPLVLESSLGCDSLLLVNINYAKVYLPNIFSPSSLIGNNVFKPIIAEGVVASVQVTIYDRWGGEVYVGQEWDGIGQSPGVYVYKVNVSFEQGEPEVLFGEVTLIQ